MEHSIKAESQTPSALEKRVMRRVRRARTLAAVADAKILALVVAVAALWGIGREVWVARVFQNAPSVADFDAFARFWLYAFADTRLVVQVLIIAMLAAALYLAREFARMLAPVSYARA